MATRYSVRFRKMPSEGLYRLVGRACWDIRRHIILRDEKVKSCPPDESPVERETISGRGVRKLVQFHNHWLRPPALIVPRLNGDSSGGHSLTFHLSGG